MVPLGWIGSYSAVASLEVVIGGILRGWITQWRAGIAYLAAILEDNSGAAGMFVEEVSHIVGLT